jgi:hypothetical protein
MLQNFRIERSGKSPYYILDKNLLVRVYSWQVAAYFNSFVILFGLFSGGAKFRLGSGGSVTHKVVCQFYSTCIATLII